MNQDHIDQTDSAILENTGKDIAKLLNTHANRLSMRTLKQLEDGRERAVKAHARQLAGTQINRNGTLSQIFGWAGHHRMAMASLAFVTVLTGVLAVQLLRPNQHSDAFLLSADLPPEAFVDRGFEPSLNHHVDFGDEARSKIMKL